MSFRNAFGLADKVCGITGSGSGIGRGIALALAGDGAVVAILDRNTAGAEETLAEVQSQGGRGIAVTRDVGEVASIDTAAKAVQAELGGADVLINNAGIIRAGALERLSLVDWNMVLNINLTGYFLCAQAFSRSMLSEGSGALVHISSIAASVATPFAGAYSMSKAA